MDKKRKAAIQKQEDQALTRALIWFAAAMVVEFLLLLVNNIYGGNQYMLAYSLMKAMYFIAGGCLVAGGAAAFWCCKSTKAKGELAFFPMVLSVTLLVLAGSAVLVRMAMSALGFLTVIVPAGAVLALVYYLYQKEFFLSVCAMAISALGLWLIRRNSGAHDLMIWTYVVLACVVLAALLVLTLRIKGNNGVFQCKGLRFVCNPKHGGLTPVLVSCVIGMAALVAGVLLGSVSAFYLLFAVLAWLLALLVYYTIKLM